MEEKIIWKSGEESGGKGGKIMLRMDGACISYFYNPAGTDAPGARVDTSGGGVSVRHSNTLYVRLENTLGFVIGMAYIIANHSRFSAYAAGSHG